MTEMKAILGVLADSMTLNPSAGALDVRVNGESDGELPVRLTSTGHEVVIDVSPALGGADDAPDPVTHALMALGACQLISFQWWSARLDVEVDRVTIVVRSHSDLRGSLGAEDGVRPGPLSVDVEVSVTGPDTPARYAEVERAVQSHSPVLDLFTNGTEVTTTTLALKEGPHDHEGRLG